MIRQQMEVFENRPFKSEHSVEVLPNKGPLATQVVARQGSSQRKLSRQSSRESKGSSMRRSQLS